MAIVAVVLAAAVHVVRTLALFPTPGAAIDGRPLMTGDHPFHVLFATRGLEHLRLHGMDWGYVPDVLGGIPKSPHYDSSVVPLELTSLLTGLEPARAAKLLLFIVPLAELAGAGLAAWVLWGAGGVAVVAAGQVALFWLGQAWVMAALGLTAFLCASALLPAFAAAWVSGRTLLAIALAAPLVVAHPHGPIMVAVVAVPALLLERPFARALTRAVALAAVSAAVLAPLLVGLVAYAPIAAPEARARHWAAVSAADPLTHVLGRDPHARHAGLLEGTLWVAGVLGLLRMAPLPRRAGIAAGVLLCALAFYGAAVPGGAAIQPRRLTQPLALAALAAGSGPLAALAARAWTSPAGRGSVGALVVVLAGLLSTGVVLTHPSVRVGMSEEEHALARVIEAEVGPGQRALIESSDVGGIFGGEPADLGALALLPLVTARPMLNGPNPDVYISHRRLHLADGEFLGDRVERLTPDAIARVLTAFRVRLVGVITARSRRALLRLPGVRPTGRIGRLFLHVYQPSDETPGGLDPLPGRARITWEGGRLVVDEIQVAGGLVVLPCGFDPGLLADPPCRIAPVSLAGLPVPLLGLEGPGRRHVLSPDLGALVRSWWAPPAPRHLDWPRAP